ncbi:MAG: PAS domain S-box protein, partial [Chloroflexota bacterium]
MTLPGVDQPGENILIIDDAPDNLRLLSQMLSSYYKVRLAPSGTAGLQAARLLRPDLILLDILLPDIDGIEVARRLKADPLTGEIPLIFVSALGDSASIERGFAVGGADYVTKPFREAEVISRVRAHLALHTQLRNARRGGDEQFQAIFTNHDAVMLLVDPDNGAIIDANPAAQRFYGYSLAQLTRMHISQVNMLPPEELQRFRTQAVSTQHSYFIFPHRLANGQLRSVEVYSSPVRFQGRTLLFSIIHDATDRMRADQARRASEERYRVLMSSLDALVATVDRQGRFLFVNEQAAGAFERTPEELIGSSIPDLLPAHEAEKPLAKIRQVFETGQRLVVEASFPLPSGRRWFHHTFQPIFDDAGQVAQVLLNSTDIHELKTAQQELLELNRSLEARVRERSAEIQDLYDNAPCGYHSLDAEARYLQVNQTELNWLGCTRQALLGAPMIDWITPGSQAMFWEGFAELKQSGRVQDIELEMRCQDGSVLPVLLNASAVYDAAGNFVMSRSTMIDNANRKRAEAALLASEEKFERSFHASPVAMTLGRLSDKRIVSANQAFLNLYGLTLQDVIGKTIFDLNLNDLVEGDPQRHQLMREQGVFHNLEAQYLTRSGRRLYVLVSAALICLQGADHVIVTMVDITARMQAEMALQETQQCLKQQAGELSAANAQLGAANAQLAAANMQLGAANAALENANQVKNEFIAMMSHELRTPLTPVLGLSDALLSGVYGSLTEKQQHSLQIIHQSSENLLRVINDILEFAKLESGRFTLDLEPVVIAASCQAAVQAIQKPAREKGLQVRLTQDIGLPSVQVDPRRLNQMLSKLLNNAVKFTAPGGQIGLEVTLDEPGRQVRFTVWDTGIGIPSEQLPHLFQPFVQLDGALSRRFEGTGFGLAFVGRIARQMGGSVGVESRPGQGSRFWFELPLDPAAPADLPGRPPAPVAAGASTGLSPSLSPGLSSGLSPDLSPGLSSSLSAGMPAGVPGAAAAPGAQAQAASAGACLLVVEDTPTNRDLLQDVLESRGYRVVTAAEGLQAIEQAQAHRPDLILMDIQM